MAKHLKTLIVSNVVMRKLLTPFIVFSLFLPEALAATARHSVVGDLQSWASGFRALFNGSSSGFINGVVGGMPLIGLFVVVFGLMMFVTKITIFRKEEYDKYARMMGIGIALLGLAQQSVYNAILGWSTMFVTITFIITIVFMLFMWWSYNFARKHEIETDRLSAKTARLGAEKGAMDAQRDLSKVKHELEKDEMLYRKMERDLKELDRELRDTHKIHGDELQVVDKIGDLLRKATAAAQRGDDGMLHGYVQALARDLGSLITSMKHEGLEDTTLGESINNISSLLAKWEHDQSTETKQEDHLLRLMKKVTSMYGHSFDDKQHKKMINDEYDEIKGLRGKLIKLHELLVRLQTLLDNLTGHQEEMDKFGYQSKHLEASQVRTYIMNQQFEEAHKHLDNLRALIEQGPAVLRKIYVDKNEIQSLLQQAEEVEQEIKTVVNERIEDLKKSIKKAKDDAEAKEKVVKSANGQLSDEVRNLYRRIHSIYTQARSYTDQISGTSSSDFFSSSSSPKTITNNLAESLKFLNDYLNDLRDIDNRIQKNIKDTKSSSEDAISIARLIGNLHDHLSGYVHTFDEAATAIGSEHMNIKQNLKKVHDDLSTLHSDLITFKNRVEDIKWKPQSKK